MARLGRLERRVAELEALVAELTKAPAKRPARKMTPADYKIRVVKD